MQNSASKNIIKLPEPCRSGTVSVEHALYSRRSIRKFSPNPLTLAEISQLLWSAQGISSPHGYRTAPSAGALYPLEIYLLAGNVRELPNGIYTYDIRARVLIEKASGDCRSKISRAALNQSSVAAAPAALVFCAVYERITGKYGNRGMRYVFMEVGHAAQNVCLQATALGLGAVVIGAFDDEAIRAVVNLAENERPVYLIPVGR